MFVWVVVGVLILIIVMKFSLSSNISVQDAKEKLESGAVVIDVRTPTEFNSGHLDMAINIPIEEIEKIKHKVNDKNKPILLYCLSGMRAASACGTLKRIGYTDVHNVGSYSRALKLVK